MHGSLVVCPQQIDLGKEAITREVVGIIVDVTDGNGSGVKSSIWRADDQELSKRRAVPSLNMALN
jgi:hypothetical protein